MLNVKNQVLTLRLTKKNLDLKKKFSSFYYNLYFFLLLYFENTILQQLTCIINSIYCIIVNTGRQNILHEKT